MVDMEQIREEHGLAQARAESDAVDRLRGRLGGTVMFRQGHRSGFWAGVEHALTVVAPTVVTAPPAEDADGTSLLTVVEYAERHCREHGEVDDLREQVQRHVDTLILGALVSGFSLWKVGIDADGRVSLIWQSMPADLWDALMVESLKVVALKSILEGLL
jgi:hypothetical protein